MVPNQGTKQGTRSPIELLWTAKNACNIYLTYSNNSKYFLKSLAHGKYFNFFCKHWREGIQNKHICFINTYQSVIISYIDKLLFKELQSPVEMSDMTDMDSNTLGDIEEKRWIITNLSENQTKDNSLPNTVSDEHDLEGHFYKELNVSYSKKQFPKMFKITRCLLKKGVLGQDELILGKENLMDFLAFTQTKFHTINNSSCFLFNLLYSANSLLVFFVIFSSYCITTIRI